MMTDNRDSIEVTTDGPSYLGWRGELLAELALARVPGLVVHKRSECPSANIVYDFLAATEDGTCFFVVVKSFSSFRSRARGVAGAAELKVRIDADLVRRASRSHSPVILFLFDADSEHGRFLRLDTLPVPADDAEFVVVRIPRGQTINRENLELLIAELQVATQK